MIIAIVTFIFMLCVADKNLLTGCNVNLNGSKNGLLWNIIFFSYDISGELWPEHVSWDSLIDKMYQIHQEASRKTNSSQRTAQFSPNLVFVILSFFNLLICCVQKGVRVRADMCHCERVSCAVPDVTLDVVPLWFVGCCSNGEMPDYRPVSPYPTANFSFVIR